MNELLISLDSNRKSPLYEQIYEHIKGEIQVKRLKAGERLPSSRALCAQLSVSRSTVDLAYAQLVAEGYVESIPSKGYYICEIEGLFYQKKGKQSILNKEIQNKEIQNKEMPERSYAYDFALNGIDSHGFPENAWKKLSKKVWQEDTPTLFQLGDPCGEGDLREAIVTYLYHARGVKCTKEQMIVGAGNDYLLLLLGTILGKSYKIAMENPTYKSAYQVFKQIGYEVKAIESDEKGMDISALEDSKAEVAYVMPSHQFPMGTVMPMKRRMQLLEWADSSQVNGVLNRYIIEDDYDSEFRYKGKPIPALQGFDQKDHVIYLGTFSKSIAPAIRISYMVLPHSLIRKYEEQGKIFSATVSKADQKMIELFLKEGYYERHLNKMRAIYKAKHDILLRELHEMTQICTYAGENAGVHLLLHFINGLTEQEIVEKARKVGVKVYGLSQYYVKEVKDAQKATILMGYATLSEEEIKEAMKRLKQCFGRDGQS